MPLLEQRLAMERLRDHPNTQRTFTIVLDHFQFSNELHESNVRCDVTQTGCVMLAKGHETTEWVLVYMNAGSPGTIRCGCWSRFRARQHCIAAH
jgi:hypothetical protein